MPDARIDTELPNYGALLSPLGAGGGARDAAEAALTLIRNQGWAYAKAEAPTSPYANLSGNGSPGHSRLAWLRGLNKCNQFVGDALTAAGFRMPTYQMRDGSEHYMLAEDLPRQPRYFERLGAGDAVLPGDIYVLDYGTAPGASGAHTEVIVGLNGQPGVFSTAGAHRNGASVSTLVLDPRRWQFDPQRTCWFNGTDSLYLLRPRERIG